MGFHPQRPLRKAYKQNPKAVKNWLDTEYPDIADRAKKRMQKFTGEMKRAFATTVIMVEVMPHVVKRLLFEFIPDVKGLI